MSLSNDQDFTRALPHYQLRLFVAGTSPRSLRSVVTLRRLCDRHLAGRVDLEVVDIYQQPELAEQDQVAAPTLVKLMPLPLCRIIGDLSDERRVLHALDLASHEP
jgi:circadian clock protein KaiB